MTPLRQRMIEDMQVRNLSPHTIDYYVRQVALFARYFKRSPELLGLDEIRAYQLHLAHERKAGLGQLQSGSLRPPLPVSQDAWQGLEHRLHPVRQAAQEAAPGE